jgi:hypothetical protein
MRSRRLRGLPIADERIRHMSRPEHEPRKDRVSQFERAVIFRVARAYFLAMAAFAVLLCAVIGLRGVMKAPIAEPARPTPPVARKAVSFALVQEELPREVDRAKTRGASSDCKTTCPPLLPAGSATHCKIGWTLSCRRSEGSSPSQLTCGPINSNGSVRRRPPSGVCAGRTASKGPGSSGQLRTRSKSF